MDFKIDTRQQNFKILGEISQAEIERIYCAALKIDRDNLFELSNNAAQTNKLSDYLLYISELARVIEDLDFSTTQSEVKAG